MRNDVTLEIFVDIACTNAHPVADIVLNPLESGLSKRGTPAFEPFVPMLGSVSANSHA